MKVMKLVWLMASAGLLVGCGGGSDDAAEVPDIPDPPPTILSNYDFEIGGVQPGTDMTVDVGGQFQVGMDLGNTLLGSVNLQVISPTNVSFLDFVTDAGSTMTVTVAGTKTNLDGQFTVNVTTAVIADFDDEPTSGVFEVVTAADTTTVTFVTNGVEMSLDGAAAVSFTWEEYDDLLDDPLAETWQRRASLAGGAFSFIFDRVFEIAELLDDLERTESPNPIVTACDSFPGTPPPGVLLQGEHVLTRLGSGEDLSPGDVFDWTFTNCWNASSNTLIDSFVQMQNYIEVIDSSNTLTRIGFAPDNSVGGGVLYFDWSVAETEEIQGVFTIDLLDRIEVNGGFSMVFTQP
ncbi:MAG: hypothetical protein QNJ07_03175 [Woeseiaceae bacterium]|nr:hypothetical protein [Woeseiaceae bacterium]